MGDVGLSLSYVLPRTEVTVEVTHRGEVRAVGGQHYRKDVADVQVTTQAVADSDYRQILAVDAGLLEKISLVLTLDDRGFITAVNSEAGRDISPVISLVGKAVSLATAIVVLGVLPVRPMRTPDETSLEDLWESGHQDLERLRTALLSQAGRLLDAMADAETEIPQLHGLGEALEAVQTQLANLSEARRAWIAGQVTEGSKLSWKLTPEDLYRLDGPTFPASVEPRRPQLSTVMKELVDDHAVLIAISDPSRPKRKAPNDPMERDHLALRRSRPVSIGVYTNDPDRGWSLDSGSIRFLDVVDDFGITDPLSLDGSWWRMKKFELSYHPDMSLKTFGVSTSSQVSAMATSTGDLLDALGQARKDLSGIPSEADKELAKAKTQLELLQTATDQEVLAATRNRASELAVLEQQKKLRDAQS